MCTTKFPFNLFGIIAGILLVSSSLLSNAQPGPDVFFEGNPYENGQQLDPNFIDSQDAPKIQVVFALDVTGSMSGLLSAAKDKIWSIATSLAQAENSPQISMGIVAYRDRGDDFVTKIIDLNTDLDLVYSQLMALSAGGGGDTPESVNQAIFDAVTRISWDNNQNTMRTIFLVGDCPPHMDYPDDVKYPESCRMANEKDITINTILMGNSGGAISSWQSIASNGSGDFIQAGMDAGSLAISTPYDEEIKRKSAALEQTKIHYGEKETRKVKDATVEEKVHVAETMAPEAAARRATYLNTTSSGSAAAYDDGELINDIAKGKVKLEEIAVDDLPDELAEMDEEERVHYVDTMISNRNQTEVELNELIRQRDSHIENEISVISTENSFTWNVFNSLKNQADKKKIKMAATPAY
jgi:hypothetical protein